MSNPVKNATNALLSDVAEFSNYQFGKLYYDGNRDKYLYSNKTGWYSYNEHNILENHKKEPEGLLNNVSEYLQDYIKNEMDNLKIEGNENYKKQHTSLFKAFKMISSSTIIKSIICFLPSFFLVKDLDVKIDAFTHLFAFKNKVFDIKNGHYRSIEKTDFICRNTGYDAPASITDFKIIDELLYSIFEDKEVCQYYLMTTAMSLFTNKFEKLYILTGNGRNGKGVLSSIITKSLGQYYMTGSNDLLTIKDELKNSTLAVAMGIRYLAISEPAEDNDKETKFNLSMVKKLTGRDIITARGLYKDPVEYVPQFTMFISCNKQPTVDETNEAIKNRFRFIHFPFTFVEEPKRSFERKLNVDLKDDIEQDDIYRDTMIHYLLHLVSQDYDIKKIKEPKKCTEFTKTYFEDNNDVGLFLDKYFDIVDDNTSKIRAPDLLELYSRDGEYKKLSTIKFAEALKTNNITKKRFTEGTYYLGLKRKCIINEEDNEVASSLDI